MDDRNLELPLYTSASSNTSPIANPVEVVTNSNGNIATSGTNISNGKWTPQGSGGTSNAATALNGNTGKFSGTSGAGTVVTNEWFYSWYAATAGSGTEAMVTTSGDASLSI